MRKPKILILGKLPPPLMGPAIATGIILNSSLNDDFELIHVKTNINDSVSSMGRFGVGKMFKSFLLYLRFFFKCLIKRPNLVLVPVSQTTMGFLKDSVFILLAKLSFRKVVIQLRGSNWKNWLNASGGGTNSWVRFVLKRCAGVIVLGDCLRYLFEDYFESNQIFVVPNGSNYEIPEPQKKEKVQVLYLANFLPTKGFDVFLEALAKLKTTDVEEYEVNAFGAWDNEEFKASCINLINKEELPVKINEPVSGKDKMRQFSNADLFCFIPQHPEGHPWVIVEAMSAGLPIVSTDQGAIRESVLEGVNGYIVPNQDVQYTSDKLYDLIKSEPLRKEFGDASLNHYKNNFTEEAMVNNLKNVFNTLVS